MHDKILAILAAVFVSATLSAGALAEKNEKKQNIEKSKTKADISDISFGKYLDKSSPMLMRTEDPDAGGERPATKPGAKTR